MRLIMCGESIPIMMSWDYDVMGLIMRGESIQIMM